jgi:hypothetical protein
MLFSAAVFGFFGFMMSFPEIDVQTGKTIPLVITLKWTLRVAAIAFFAAAIVSMIAISPGNLLFSFIGLCSAVMFVVIAIWDLSSPFHSGVHPFILLIFAAWNGYGSWMGLQDIFARRAARVPPASRIDR